jgi:hypothetical protein
MKARGQSLRLCDPIKVLCKESSVNIVESATAFAERVAGFRVYKKSNVSCDPRNASSRQLHGCLLWQWQKEQPPVTRPVRRNGALLFSFGGGRSGGAGRRGSSDGSGRRRGCQQAI